MAQDSWPSPAHNARGVTDTEYEKIAARFSDDGVYGSPSDAAVVAAGAGLAVNIRADVYASVRGHAWTSGTSTVSLPVGSNTAGQTRTDRVVLRLDRSTWTVRAAVKPGTPGGSAPTLAQQTGDTGTYEIPLARVTVLNGASAVSVAREELYVGSRVRSCTSSSRNPSPARGEMCFETDTGIVRVWTGTAWKIVYEDSGTIVVDAAVSGWSATSGSVLQKHNGVVYMRLGNFNRTGANLAAGTESRLPVLIPAAYRHPNRDHSVMAYTTGVEISRLVIYSNGDRAGQVWLLNHPQINKGQNVIPQSGLSWVVG
ncbi:hypothetical protein ACIHCX_10640 [Streptomyces sp. NPDC052043]|uniref:hypothetical protein n=1 Tax=Streptomyces sp. NPDC052043 TaxID=3365684 RepID=UPI0037D1939A